MSQGNKAGQCVSVQAGNGGVGQRGGEGGGEGRRGEWRGGEGVRKVQAK